MHIKDFSLAKSIRVLGRAASFPSSLAPPCNLCSHHSCLMDESYDFEEGIS